MTVSRYPVSTDSGPDAHDFTIYRDGANYFARREKDARVPYRGTSLDGPFNSATAALNNNTSEAIVNSLYYGGTVWLAKPAPTNTLETNDVLNVYANMGVKGLSRGTVVKASSTFPNVGTLGDPRPVIGSGNYRVSPAKDWKNARVFIENLSIDCNGRAAQGILHRRAQGADASAIGGPNGQSHIMFNEVYNFTVCGIQVGVSGIDTSGTTNTWLMGNFIRDGTGSTSRAMAHYTGDGQIEWNNILGTGASSYALYLDEGTVQVKHNHISYSGTNSDNANVYLQSGSHTQIIANYLDNVQKAEAVHLQSGAGSVNISGNHINGGALDPTLDNQLAVFRFASGVDYVNITNNSVIGNPTTGYFKSLVGAQQGTADSTLVVGNRTRGVNKLCTQQDRASTTVTTPKTAWGNHIQKNTAPLIPNNSLIPTKAGVPTDADFDSADIGQVVLDTTNSRIYFKTAASAGWKFVAIA